MHQLLVTRHFETLPPESAHAQALGEYLVNRPDLYEVTATKSKGWLSKGTEYSVTFAELVIE